MKVLIVLAMALNFSPTLLGACAPRKMLRIVTQNESPDLVPGSFGALPKTIYRLGNRYARIEEQPDRAAGLHQLIVVNTPDTWVVNLTDRTARHFVDADPEGDLSVLLFPPGTFGETFPNELERIEIGCEVAFFDSHGSPKTVLKTENGTKITQAVGLTGWRLVLVRDRESGPPVLLFVFEGDEIVSAIRYLTWEELEPDEKLFSRPKDVTITAPAD
ncbi:MAG: hypothetical protein WBX15_06075 [Thermoanaerobaculia bacterium]